MTVAVLKTNKRKPAGVHLDDDSIISKAYDPNISRRLLRYVHPYRRPLVAALCFMSVAQAANIAGPYLIKVALDSGVARSDAGMLAQVVLLYLVASVVSWVGTYVRVRIMAVTGQSIILDLRRELFDH